MFIQPTLTQSITDVILPAGEYISVGNIGDDATTVFLKELPPYVYESYTQLAELNNTAQTFGTYPVDRTIRIVSGVNSTVQYDVGASPSLNGFPALVIQSLEPVSLVEPAATFVTLTYDDDSGNVRLNSAGAHGLTAAVAVGNDAYITWTGGTGVTGFYEITALDSDTTGTAVTIDLPYIDSTVTITIAAPGVITWANHGLSVDDTIRFTTTGALPTGLSTGTTYYVKQVLSANTFTVASSAGGSAITTSGTQSGTHTALVWYGTAVMAVANTVVTVATFTIPGSSMGVGGQMQVDALFSMTNNATVKTIGMTYGGTTFASIAAASNASACVQRILYNRGNSDVLTSATNLLGPGLSTSAVTSLAEDASADQVFAITLRPATANNVMQLESYKLTINF